MRAHTKVGLEPENNVVLKHPCHKIGLLSESHEIGASHNISWKLNQLGPAEKSNEEPEYMGRESRCHLVHRRSDKSCKTKSGFYFLDNFRPICQVEACGICKDSLLQVRLWHLIDYRLEFDE